MSRPSSKVRVVQCWVGGGRRRLRPGGLRRRAVPVLERLELRQLLSLTPAQPSTPTPRGDGPTVVAVQRFGFHAQPTLVVLQFNEPLDPVPAQNPSNYIIQNFKSRPVGIRSAVYDPATDTVLLRPGQRLNLHHPAQLLVMGTSPTGLTNTNGILLDGADTGQPGSNFSTFLRRRNLAGPAPFGASANL